jgi:thymidylate synthase (FAD)
VNTTIKLLDHGFITLRNISGPTRRLFNYGPENDIEGWPAVHNRPFDADDIDPANSARMSFNQADSGRTREQDLKLAEYLLKNWHTTPFEMVEIWLEMKLPIFVARQFVRHRTCTINEVSGRYITLPAEWYIPDVVGGKAANKKQGQEDNLDLHTQEVFKTQLKGECKRSYDKYLYFIEQGVASEHARLFLHLNHYTHWIWKQDLHNVMHFLRLRDHNHAQIEAQKFAQAVTELLKQHLPHSMALYEKYRKQESK